MASRAAPRYVVGVYDQWSPLIVAATEVLQLPDLCAHLSVMGRVSSFSTPLSRAVAKKVHAPRVGHALNVRVNLTFERPPEAVSCSDGDLARKLERRINQGSSSLGDAFDVWMTRKQALRFETEVGRGRLLMWSLLRSPDGEQRACELLLQPGVARVEVHDLVPVTPRGNP